MFVANLNYILIFLEKVDTLGFCSLSNVQWVNMIGPMLSNSVPHDHASPTNLDHSGSARTLAGKSKSALLH